MTFHVKFSLIFHPHLPDNIFTQNSLRDLVKQWLGPGFAEFSAQVGYRSLRVQILDNGVLTQLEQVKSAAYVYLHNLASNCCC